MKKGTQAGSGRSSSPRRVAGTSAIAFATLLLSASIAFASLDEIGNDLRISNTGADTVASREADDASVAHNSTANQYLIVWEDDGHALDDEREIFGQILGADGTVVKDDFQISNFPDSAGRDTFEPDVAYNAIDNEYLVVWHGDGVDNDVDEVFGQRLEADGSEPTAGVTADFQIADVASDRDTADASVAHNPSDNEYLVVWNGDDLVTPAEDEIFGQRIEADGTETGADDFRISNSGADTATALEARDPALAFNSAPGATEFLIVWEQDGHGANDVFEVFGQRVDADGSQLGAGNGDFRISNANDVGAGRTGHDAALAFNPNATEYLVVWAADALPATAGEQEVFGQRVDADGSQLGAGNGDFRISNVGADGDASRAAENPTISYDSDANEFLVSFQADALADNDREIYGQRVGSTGSEIGSDFRFSEMTDAGTGRDAFDADAVYNPAAKEHFVVWDGDGLATGNEIEIFGQFLAVPPPDPPPADPPPADLPPGTPPPGDPPPPDDDAPESSHPTFGMTLDSNAKGVITASLLTPREGRFEGEVKVLDGKKLEYRSKSVRARPHQEVSLVFRLTDEAKDILKRSKEAPEVKVSVTFEPNGDSKEKLSEKLNVDVGKTDRIAKWVDVTMEPSFSWSVGTFPNGRSHMVWSGTVTAGAVNAFVPANSQVPAKLKQRARSSCSELPFYLEVFINESDGDQVMNARSDLIPRADSFEFIGLGNVVADPTAESVMMVPSYHLHAYTEFEGKEVTVFCTGLLSSKPI